jgi:hypothetical protein
MGTPAEDAKWETYQPGEAPAEAPPTTGPEPEAAPVNPAPGAEPEGTVE